MTVIDLHTYKGSKELLKELKGRRFFAISLESGVFQYHVPKDINFIEVIYGCESLKHCALTESMIPYDDTEINDG